MKIPFLLCSFFLAAGLGAFASIASIPNAVLAPKVAEVSVVANDVVRILNQAGLKGDAITFTVDYKDGGGSNTVALQCDEKADKVQLRVLATPQEWSSTLYYGLQKLGFLFPHPRIQRGTNRESWHKLVQDPRVCGRAFEWKPRFKFRGFHLHTQHPNEWVSGFFLNQPKIADDMIRWHARNGQNVIQVVLLANIQNLRAQFAQAFSLAKGFGIVRGVDVSFESMQQRSYWLGSLLMPNHSIVRNINNLNSDLDFDFLTVELGTSEFTSGNKKAVVKWIETARKQLERAHQALFVKAHVSTEQKDTTGQNFNYIAQSAELSVGVLAHTVMFFGLEGPAPVYGRQDFEDMKRFLFSEHAKGRPAWYFPETSYYVGMDIDVGGLWLGEYIRTRAEDMNLIEKQGIPGHLTFTTGQEMGYGIIDWSVALLNNSENKDNPLIAFQLLGEDSGVWNEILNFQRKYIKDAGLLPILSSSTVLDELSCLKMHLIQRNLILDLKKDRIKAIEERNKLAAALANLPSLSVIEGIHDGELRAMIELNHLRMHYAFALRSALVAPDGSADRMNFLALANQTMASASAKLAIVQREYNHYPESIVFKSSPENPTSYPEGYGQTTASLYYWRREKKMILNKNFSPLLESFKDPLYRPFRVVQLGRIFSLF